MPTTVQVLPSAARTGTITSPAAPVPAGLTSVLLDIQSTTFTDPATSIQETVEFSYNGGVTFQPEASITFTGGAKTMHAGHYGLNVSLGTPYPTHARGTLVITGTVTFSLVATTYP